MTVALEDNIINSTTKFKQLDVTYKSPANIIQYYPNIVTMT